MLINCVAYERGHRLHDVALDDIPPLLARSDVFVWVALRDPDAAELELMQRTFGLHELAIEDVRNADQRPKIEEYDGVLFAVMQLVEWRDGDTHCAEVDVFTGPNFVLSVRSRSERDFLGVRARAEREPERLALGPGYVFYALADAVVDRYLPVLDALESELESIEATMFSDEPSDPRSLIRRLYRLKQRSSDLRHAVVPLYGALGKLFGGRVPPTVQNVEDYFRDVHDHLARVLAGLESLRETIAIAIQVNLSMVTIEQSDVGKKLAAWAAIFALVTGLAGIWGMNFEHMPELGWLWGYPAALGLMATSAGVLWWRFRRAGWL